MNDDLGIAPLVKLRLESFDPTLSDSLFNIKVRAKLNSLPVTNSEDSLDFTVSTTLDTCTLVQFNSQAISPMHFMIYPGAPAET